MSATVKVAVMLEIPEALRLRVGIIFRKLALDVADELARVHPPPEPYHLPASKRQMCRELAELGRAYSEASQKLIPTR